jgi:hypothetical protein
MRQDIQALMVRMRLIVVSKSLIFAEPSSHTAYF